jgi:signal transduction histidine kinase
MTDSPAQQPPTRRRRLLVAASPVFVASIVTAIGLALVGWFDYSATRGELVRLLRDQAMSLKQTVAAAARSNEAAAAQAEDQVGERLLDNARLLAEIDRRGALSTTVLDEMAARNRLFRITVFAPDGTRERSNSGGGFPPAGRGFGSALVDRLLHGTASEMTSDLHAARWGGGARIAAGVRRANGGAIVLNVDASDVAALRQQTSLDKLVHEIATSANEIAYVILQGPDARIAEGDVPGSEPPRVDVATEPATRLDAPLAERELMVGGRPVLEFSGPIRLTGEAVGQLSLGLRLDGLRQTERRLFVRSAVSVVGALVVSVLALWAIWLRRAYGTLSEKHAVAEAALRRRDRLSAMGELAATVAHEIRNPLNAIAMSSKRLRREFQDVAEPCTDEDRRDRDLLLGVLEQETQRINGIVQQFLEFARPPALVLRSVDLAAALSGVVEANREFAASRGVALEASLTAGRVTVDPDQMRQAAENLVRNAVEATPAGGHVTVTTRSAGRGHIIEISDTGAGIDAENLPRIFDLYFTTKADGTGVGLAVTQQIVSAHGGTIEVQSAPGRGTCMTIRLPAVPAEPTRD